MKFVDGLQKAYQKRWSYINTFRVRFNFDNTPKLKQAANWNENEEGEDINLHIVSIDTPQFTNQPIEVFVANKWVIHNGRDELYRFSVTFRDHNRMDLYRKFVTMYNVTKDQYPDNAKFGVEIYKDGDYYSEGEKLLFYFDETMIEAVSQLQFNNTTENQIAEFTVNFKTTKPYLNA